jgi:uncharacterized surface protein with fasciclin (FAS1) repeats
MRRDVGFVAVGVALTVLLSGCGKFIENGRVGRAQSTVVVETTRTMSGTEPSATKTPTASVEPTLVADGKHDLAYVIDSSSSLSTFGRLWEASGMMPVLRGKRPLTVVAPNDDAFSELGTKTVEALLAPANKEKLQNLLRYHLMTGSVPVMQLVTIRTALTFHGGRLKITQDGSTVVINGSVVVLAPDVQTRNGLVHVVNTVMVPPGLKL